MRTFILIALLIVSTGSAVAQQGSHETTAQQVAAAFTKNKHAFKEKFGIRIEKYKDVRSEPLVRPNISDYSGVYEVLALEFVINLKVGSDGKVDANGHEKGSRTFKLENAKIEGAVLTGSKHYQDGTTEKFEGVFLTRTDRYSPTDVGVTILGLGVLLDAPVDFGSGVTYDKLFYELRQ